MSQGIACKCSDPRLVVLQRNSRRSAFDSYRVKWSPYSCVACCSCGTHWRTRAKMVDALPDVGPLWPQYPVDAPQSREWYDQNVKKQIDTPAGRG